jgi:hypothetical protein
VRAELAVSWDARLIPCSTQDVSLGGLRVRGRLVAAPGDSVVAILSAPRMVVPTLVRVVSSELLVREGWNELRLRFEHMSPVRLARISELLEEASRPVWMSQLRALAAAASAARSASATGPGNAAVERVAGVVVGMERHQLGER